jgi:hypothetical protein
MLVLLFERLLPIGDWSGGGSEYNSGWWNFSKNKKGKEDSEAEKEERKQSISRGIMDGNYKGTWLCHSTTGEAFWMTKVLG